MKHKTRRIIIDILHWTGIILLSPVIIILVMNRFIAKPIDIWASNLLIKAENYLIRNYPSKE